MAFWPFNRPSPNQQIKRNRQAIDALELELVELRELNEKIMAAVKRIQGKTYRRKRADMEEAVQLEPPPEGGEPTLQPVTPDGGPQLQPLPTFDRKAELRRRGHILRGR